MSSLSFFQFAFCSNRFFRSPFILRTPFHRFHDAGTLFNINIREKYIFIWWLDWEIYRGILVQNDTKVVKLRGKSNPSENCKQWCRKKIESFLQPKCFVLLYIGKHLSTNRRLGARRSRYFFIPDFCREFLGKNIAILSFRGGVWVQNIQWQRIQRRDFNVIRRARFPDGAWPLPVRLLPR